MYMHFKQTARIIAFFCLAMSVTPEVSSQRAVVVSVNTVMLGPPYNVPFDQIKDKIRVTVLSNTSMEGVYLGMTLRGDNGIVIQSNGNQTDPFYIEAAVPLVIPGAETGFDIIFQQQNLSFSNVDPNTVYQYGLPPGHYQMCFRLWNPFGNAGPVALSPAPPLPDVPISAFNNRGSISARSSDHRMTEIFCSIPTRRW